MFRTFGDLYDHFLKEQRWLLIRDSCRRRTAILSHQSETNHPHLRHLRRPQLRRSRSRWKFVFFGQHQIVPHRQDCPHHRYVDVSMSRRSVEYVESLLISLDFRFLDSNHLLWDLRNRRYHLYVPILLTTQLSRWIKGGTLTDLSSCSDQIRAKRGGEPQGPWVKCLYTLYAGTSTSSAI